MLSLSDPADGVSRYVLAFYGDAEQRVIASLSAFFQSIMVAGPHTELCDIMNGHGSDKASGWHNYTLLYHFMFHQRRNRVRSLLELGIGTNFTDIPSNMGEQGRPGASLRGWRDYFPEAEIVGADIDRRILFSEERISTHYVDQLSPEAIDELWAATLQAPFDVIIDDGLHTFEANSLFMERSFGKLAENGLFVIEDIVVTYDNLRQFDAFFKRFGASGFLIKLPNPRNKLDNCMAVFLAERSREDGLKVATHVSLFAQAEQAKKGTGNRDWPEAARLWRAMMDRIPEDLPTTLAAAKALVELRRFDEAETILEEAVTQFPNNLWASLQHASLAAQRADWGEALRRWVRFRNRFPNALEVYSGLGQALRELGRVDEADAVFREGTERAPDNIWLWLDYAQVSARRGDTEEALRRSAMLRERFPNQAHGYLEGALVLWQAKRTAEAENLMRDALELAPGDFWVAFHHARFATEAQRWTDAAERWRRVRTEHPHDPSGFLGQAEAERELGQFDLADDILAEAAGRFPHNEAIASEQVKLALARRAWPEVARVWAALNERFPPASGVAVEQRSRLRGLITQAHPAATGLGLDLDRPLCGAVFTEDPVIIFSASNHEIADGFDIVEPIARFYEGRTVYVLLWMVFSLVHQVSSRERYRERFRALSETYPNIKITVFANDVNELNILRQLGIRSELVNHNALVDENIFRITEMPKTYDAVYTASFSPFKRHELAVELDNSHRLLLLVSHSHGGNREAIDDLKSLLPHATIANERPAGIRTLVNTEVALELNKAKCGLCLSAQEGAMYASIEYLLCGLPIVTTRNIGGRNWFFTTEYTLFCDDEPAAVAAAIQRVIEARLSGEYIRQNTLERIKRERLALFSVIDQIFRENGQNSRRSSDEFATRFFDRMNYHARPLRELLAPA
jgi:tetratricopeptide (TPR) repeat protein